MLWCSHCMKAIDANKSAQHSHDTDIPMLCNPTTDEHCRLHGARRSNDEGVKQKSQLEDSPHWWICICTAMIRSSQCYAILQQISIAGCMEQDGVYDDEVKQPRQLEDMCSHCMKAIGANKSALPWYGHPNAFQSYNRLALQVAWSKTEHPMKQWMQMYLHCHDTNIPMLCNPITDEHCRSHGARRDIRWWCEAASTAWGHV
jgi:hypothetical protein